MGSQRRVRQDWATWHTRNAERSCCSETVLCYPPSALLGLPCPLTSLSPQPAPQVHSLLFLIMTLHQPNLGLFELEKLRHR